MLFIFLLIGMAGGFAFFKLKKPVYAADIILSSNYLPNDMCAQMVNDLEEYVDDDMPIVLAQRLGISAEAADKIVKIRFSNFDEKLAERYKNKDTVVLGLPFRIEVFVKDFKLFDSLKPVLLNYFEKNPAAMFEKNIRQQTLASVNSKIERQLVELDTLKKVIANHLVPRGTPAGFVFGQPLDPLSSYREVLTLYKEELENNNLLLRGEKAIRIIRDFEVRHKPYSPKVSWSLLIGGLAGIILGYGFILLRKNKV